MRRTQKMILLKKRNQEEVLWIVKVKRKKKNQNMKIYPRNKKLIVMKPKLNF